VVDTKAKSVTARGLEGLFGVKPRHIDYISVIVPSVLTYVDEQNKMHYLAVNEGAFVKVGFNVTISVMGVTEGETIEELQKAVTEAYKEIEEDERDNRVAITKLEYFVFNQLMNFRK
jgi:F-type H+-transporting ATPase subunit epsilon